MPLPASAADTDIGNTAGITVGVTVGNTSGTAKNRNNIVNTNVILFFIASSLYHVGVTLRTACKSNVWQDVRDTDHLRIADDAFAL